MNFDSQDYQNRGIDYDLEACLVYNPQQAFDDRDIEKVLAVWEGQNEGEDWRWIIQLKDNRVVYLQGFCDYTGWDCQSFAWHKFSDTPIHALFHIHADCICRDENFETIYRHMRQQLRDGKCETWHEKTEKEFENIPVINSPKDLQMQQFDITPYLQPIHTLTKAQFETLKQQLEDEFNRVMDEEHPPADYTKLNELSSIKQTYLVEMEKVNAIRYGFGNILTPEELKVITDEYLAAQEKHSDIVKLFNDENQNIKNIEKQRLLAKARWLLSHRELLFSEWIRINKNTHEIHETFQRGDYHYEMVRNAWIDEIDDIHPENLIEYKFMSAEKVNGF